MKTNIISYLKWLRLLIAIIMLIFIPVSTYFKLLEYEIYETLIMTGLLSFFVFLIGLQYHFEKKQKNLAYFLMIFSIMMLISVYLGIYYGK
jgi:hypothetical protein